jgi:excisionase family DNA binding protein
MTDRLAAAVSELVAALREEAGSVALDAPDKLLSIDEAAHALGIGRSLTYDLISRGGLRTVRVGRRRLIPAAAVAELITERSV